MYSGKAGRNLSAKPRYLRSLGVRSHSRNTLTLLLGYESYSRNALTLLPGYGIDGFDGVAVYSQGSSDA